MTKDERQEQVISEHFTRSAADRACSKLRVERPGDRKSSGWAKIHYDVRKSDKGLRRWKVVVW